MIRITLNRNQEGRLYHFTASGHAGYAKAGQDILCAAVSILTINTANSIERFTGDEVVSHMEEETGFLEFQLKTVSKESSLLMESMLLGLKGIEESYGSYLAIKVLE